jgi:hypothetical protein
MLYETLVTLVREIDSGNWSVNDVRRFTDRMLNHQADYHEAHDYVNRVKWVEDEVTANLLKEENNEK